MEESLIAKAVERKASGKYNCAQAVACTYAERVGANEDALLRTAQAFGVGMGGMLGTCGALVGAGMAISMKAKNRPAAMQAMKRIMEKFQQRNGCTICRELKGIDTKEVVKPCNDCVADAAEFLEDELNEMALHSGKN